jgi:hypothetical protein
MADDYTGRQGLLIERLKELLSGSSNFQTLVGEATAAAAEAHIHETEYEFVSGPRPFAAIWPQSGAGREGATAISSTTRAAAWSCALKSTPLVLTTTQRREAFSTRSTTSLTTWPQTPETAATSLSSRLLMQIRQ